LYDGAHNASGAEALREYLAESVSKPITMIYGTMRGKNLEKVAALLFPLAKNLILATPLNPRALPASEIEETASGFVDREDLYIADSLEEAIAKARELVEDGLILVTGSLYLIGEIKALLNDQEVQRRKRMH
jgi:dihydrofolate synthase/folylpolyglutamate synthase